MPNLFLQLKELLAPGRVQIATVVYCANGSTIVELPGAGQVRVRGEAAVAGFGDLLLGLAAEQQHDRAGIDRGGVDQGLVQLRTKAPAPVLLVGRFADLGRARLAIESDGVDAPALRLHLGQKRLHVRGSETLALSPFMARLQSSRETSEKLGNFSGFDRTRGFPVDKRASSLYPGERNCHNGSGTFRSFLSRTN